MPLSWTLSSVKSVQPKLYIEWFTNKHGLQVIFKVILQAHCYFAETTELIKLFPNTSHILFLILNFNSNSKSSVNLHSFTLIELGAFLITNTRALVTHTRILSKTLFKLVISCSVHWASKRLTRTLLLIIYPVIYSRTF